MTVSGIIAEYNPFHTGHKYLLDQAEGLKIVAMSGNFVQRGEPAVVDKWTRAQMALAHGADLVVELPFLVAVQAADYFAEGAVALLARLGVEQLVFGTEQVIDYQAAANAYATKKDEMDAYLASLSPHLSYPQKAQLMWQSFTGLTFTGETPNHILGLAYARAAAGTSIRLRPIQRQGAGFHSEDRQATYASATALRKAAHDMGEIARFLPEAALFEQAVKVDWSVYFPFLTYQILSHPDLTQIFQVNAELASRMRAAIGRAKGVDDLVEQVATKRYTKSRVRRILTYILVQTVEQPLPEGIHVLGFTEKGQTYLKSIKQQVPIITRIGQQDWDPMTQQADRIYQLGSPLLTDQTYGRVPILPHRSKKKS